MPVLFCVLCISMTIQPTRLPINGFVYLYLVSVYYLHIWCLRISLMFDVCARLLLKCCYIMLLSSSSSDTVQGSVLLPHYRTLEVRPGRIS